MSSIKQFLINTYYAFRYPESVRLRKKGIRFDHYRELNRQWLRNAGIKTVMDVGANVGDFALLAREIFPDAAIHSFEPLPDCFDKMKNVLPGDPKFFAHNIAVGSSESELDFYRSFHSPSSSFLKMSKEHMEAFPQSAEGQSREPIKVKLNTLDNLTRDLGLQEKIFLKIDVQGFEMEALAGAAELLKRTYVVLIEMSFVKLYENLPLFHDVYSKMYEHGFRFHGSLAQMLHPVTGEVVQVDAIFVKE